MRELTAEEMGAVAGGFLTSNYHNAEFGMEQSHNTYFGGGLGFGYNSNGYVRGIIEATGGTVVLELADGTQVAIDWSDYIGGNRPVPPGEFEGTPPSCGGD